MISVQEALQVIFSQDLQLKKKKIPLDKAVDCYLAQEIIADRDFPPFNRVAMDGVAIRFSDFEKGKRSFKIGARQLAGSKPVKISEDIECIEIMTGASLPQGLDTIIRYEDCNIENNQLNISAKTSIKHNQNIHFKGQDTKKGSILARPYQKITPSVIGVAATVGLAEIDIYESPDIAIVSTGDELVNVEETPTPYQIRRSNSKSLIAALSKLNIRSKEYHISDKKTVLESKLSTLIDENNILILSGGVSKGKADFVPDVLSSLGVDKLFHSIL